MKVKKHNISFFDKKIVLIQSSSEKHKIDKPFEQPKVRLGWCELIYNEAKQKNQLYFFEDQGLFQIIDPSQVIQVLEDVEHYMLNTKQPYFFFIQFINNYIYGSDIELSMMENIKAVEVLSKNYAIDYFLNTLSDINQKKLAVQFIQKAIYHSNHSHPQEKITDDEAQSFFEIIKEEHTHCLNPYINVLNLSSHILEGKDTL